MSGLSWCSNIERRTSGHHKKAVEDIKSQLQKRKENRENGSTIAYDDDDTSTQGFRKPSR